jgi:hypothetical protein
MKLSWMTARAWMRPGLWLATLAVCELLLQWHGWWFWMENFDRRVGWAVPVVLSILAAALWWTTAQAPTKPRAGAWGTVAFVTSAVLLTGPVLRVSEPLLKQWQAAASHSAQIHALDQDLDAKRGEVKRYQSIREQGAIGYFNLLAIARTEAHEAELKRRDLLAQPQAVSWWVWAVIGLEIAALVLLQAGAALSAIWCAQTWPGEDRPPASPQSPRRSAPLPAADHKEAAGIDDLQVKRLLHVIKAAAEGAQLSVTAWGEAQMPPIHKRDLSNLSNYFAHKSQGKAPEISKAKLAELIARFLPPEAANGR